MAVCLSIRVASADEVVVRELMYHPPSGKPEFLELENITANPIDLADWQIDGVGYQFPAFDDAHPTNTFLLGFERILLTPVDEATFRLAYPQTPPGVRFFTGYAGALSNGGETLTVRDKNGLVVTRIKYDDEGEWPLSPDGVGHTLELVDAHEALDDPANWRASAERLGSPGAEAGLNSAVELQFSEMAFNSSNEMVWVELQNVSTNTLNVTNLFVAFNKDLSVRLPLSGLMVPGQYHSWDIAPALHAERVYVVDTNNLVLAAAESKRTHPQRLFLQRYPKDSKNWYSASSHTRDAQNDPDRNHAVIINEIMADPLHKGDFGEYIELYNRGAETVDLSDWYFDDGIAFKFPADILLASGEYLVVAKESAWLASIFPGVALTGDYEGRLSGRGERIRLRDADGNIADEVHYQFGGDWPDLTRGLGSSLELLHPEMDNALSSAWGASDESSKATFATYEVTSRFQNLRTEGAASDYQEMHLALVGDAHIEIQNISLRQNGTGANLITNGTVQSSTGSSADGWLAQGNHGDSFVSNGILHLRATGHGDNGANRAEIDTLAVLAGRSYTFRFDARWVYGKPRLIAQSWEHSLGAPVLIRVPENLGTPGSANSILQSDPLPEIESLVHMPAVPTPGESVRVQVKIGSVDPLASAKVIYRLDDVNGTNAWSEVNLFDDGFTGGDLVAGDETFTALVSQFQSISNIVQFYVEAETINGAVQTLPRSGADAPGMWVVDDQLVPGDLRSMRFVISAYHRDALDTTQVHPNPKYNYKYPRLSNQAFNMTLVVNESDVYYNGGIRKRGSTLARPHNAKLVRARWELPRDRPFRGQTRFVYDNDAVTSSRGKDRTSRYWLYLLGHPVNRSEIIRQVVNADPLAISEDNEPIGNEFLNRLYEDGSSGGLFRIKEEFWFSDDWTRSLRQADWGYKRSFNPIRYHTEWNLRSRESGYDFDALIGFKEQLLFGNFTEARMAEIVDPILVPLYAAVRGYAGEFDSFTMTNGKNGFFYQRPGDRRFMFFHWDGDSGYFPGHANDPFIGSRPGLQAYFGQSNVQRVFKYYLTELLDHYTENSPRITTFLDLEDQMSPDYDANVPVFESWFTNRKAKAEQELAGAENVDYQIVTGSGFFVQTSDDQLALEGFAPSTIFDIRIPEHPEATLVWTNQTQWTLSGIVLKEGVNQLFVQGLDANGVVVELISFTAAKTGNAPPVLEWESRPAAWRVPQHEDFIVDVGESYDPEGLPLSYTFAVTGTASAAVQVMGDGSAASFQFSRPGLYNITVLATDIASNTVSRTREVAVYGYQGFSSFRGLDLESFWSVDFSERRDNYSPDSWYNLSDQKGRLLLHVSEVDERPLSFSSPSHPWIHRELPRARDWVLQTELRADGRQGGMAHTGLLIEMEEGGMRYRTGYGLEDGNRLSVIRVSEANQVTVLNFIDYLETSATLRIRRSGVTLHFEQWLDEQWQTQFTQGLAENTEAICGGMFVTTDEAISKRTAFDYAMLIDVVSPPAGGESVRINELQSHPQMGGDDAIELYNASANVVDIGQWIITDEADTEKYRVPEGVVIDAFSALTFHETAFTSTPFGFSSFGDEVLLYAADMSNSFVSLVDQQVFGAAKLDETFGYYTNSEGHVYFPPELAASLGKKNVGPRIGPVVLTEMAFGGGSNQADYIELQNLRSVAVNLFSTNSWTISGVGATFPMGTTLAPQEVVLFASVDEASLRSEYGGIPPGVRIFGPWEGTLQPDGESVALQHDAPRDYDIDRVSFLTRAPWPDGPSIERIDPTQFGSEPLNWRTGSSPGITDFVPADAEIVALDPGVSVTLQATGPVGELPVVEFTTDDLSQFAVTWQPASVLLSEVVGNTYQMTVEYPVPHWQQFYLRVVFQSP